MKKIKQQWKLLADKREIKIEDIAALCIYRALANNEGKIGAITRLRKAFSKISSPVKIQNGASPYFSLKTALWLVKISSVLNWLDEADKLTVLAMAKEISINGEEIL